VNAHAEFFEKLLVGMMLRVREFKIDRLARNEAQLAIDDGGTDGPGDGSEHRKCKFTREPTEDFKASAGTGRGERD
jgi:hypothetical protein